MSTHLTPLLSYQGCMTRMTRIDSSLQLSPKVALTVNLGDVGSSGEDVSTVRQLVQLVGEHHLDTTWIVAHACQLAWVATLQNSSTRHDLALNTNWALPGMSAHKFERQLRQCRELCEQVGFVPTTIYSHEPETLRQRLKYLVQHGLTTCVIGHPVDARKGPAKVGLSDCLPRSLPLGLWQLPVTLHLPRQYSWLRLAAPAWRLPNAGRNRPAGVGMHVLIAVEQVLAQGSGGLRQVDHFLRKAAWASSARRLEVITVAQWTTKMAHRATAVPQHSILHVAA